MKEGRRLHVEDAMQERSASAAATARIRAWMNRVTYLSFTPSPSAACIVPTFASKASISKLVSTFLKSSETCKDGMNRGNKNYWTESALTKGFRDWVSADGGKKGIIYCPELNEELKSSDTH